MNKLKVLFLCTGNSCRSQMAEGWARRLKGDAVEPYSAGIDPHGMNQLAIRVMAEAGIDITSQHSKHVDDLKDVSFDYVITVCDKRLTRPAPSSPEIRKSSTWGSTTRHALPKKPPVAQVLGHYRRVRDEIRWFIEHMEKSIPELKKTSVGR